ncbi:MAG: hypothetical protein JSS60_05115 [Verrucomicrobia bacterium]|nr:hypothetical protein [Verrucomicrobiota bacterium]
MKTCYKTIIGALCLLLFLVNTSTVEAKKKKCPCSGPKYSECAEKIYLDSSDIDLTGNQIFVKIEDTIKPALALYSDNQGIFVLTKKRTGRCPEEYWEWGTCGGCSPWHAPDCDWCGYD